MHNNNQQKTVKYITIINRQIPIQNPYFYGLCIFFILTIIFASAFFISDIPESINPYVYDSKTTNSQDIYNEGVNYVNCQTDTLYYSGYDMVNRNSIKAHYYYSLNNNRCTIYIISSNYIGNPNNPPLTLNNCSFKARLKRSDNNYKQLLENMSRDLNWNYQGMLRHTSSVVINQAGYSLVKNIIITALAVIFFIMTIISAVFLWIHSGKEQ